MRSSQVFVTLILWVLHKFAVNGSAINETILENNSNATHLESILSIDLNSLYRLGDSYYKIHTDPQTWNVARQICDNEGGYLAILNTDEEARYLTSLFTIRYPESSLDNSIIDKSIAYIGFHDYFKKGEYVTIDGLNIEISGFNHWNSGEPSGPGVENCGSINRRNGLLNDCLCDRLAVFVCEIPVYTSRVYLV